MTTLTTAWHWVGDPDGGGVKHWRAIWTTPGNETAGPLSDQRCCDLGHFDREAAAAHGVDRIREAAGRLERR